MLQTDRQTTDDRQTDGRTTTYSELKIIINVSFQDLLNSKNDTFLIIDKNTFLTCTITDDVAVTWQHDLYPSN